MHCPTFVPIIRCYGRHDVQRLLREFLDVYLVYPDDQAADVCAPPHMIRGTTKHLLGHPPSAWVSGAETISD